MEQIQDNEVANPFDQVIILDPDTKEWTTEDNRTFFVNNDIDRFPPAIYELWERLSIELGFSLSFPSIFDAMGRVEKLVLDNDRLSALNELSNIKRGISRLTKDRHTIAFYMCTLFITEAGEDPFTWSVERADSKIEAWSKYGTGFFLQQAIALVNGYKERFLSTTQEFSEMSQLSQQITASLIDEPEQS